MKKGILAMLVLLSFATFAKTHEKTAKLSKDSYCKTPKSHTTDYQKINSKDAKVEIDFENCVFDGEEYNNVKVGILIQDQKKFENYLKKYKFMHLKAGKNLVLNSNGTYFYNGSWAFNNDKSYPTVFDGDKSNNNNNNKVKKSEK